MKDTLIELIWLIGGTEKIVRMTKKLFFLNAALYVKMK